MVQKYLAMVAILGAIAGLGIGMVTTVKAQEWTCHYWPNYRQCETGPYYGYTQHPTIKQIDSGQCPCGDAPGAGYACNNCPNNAFVQQPHIQVADWGSIDGNLNNPSCIHHCSSGGSNWGDDDNGYIQSQQPLKEVALTENCFWFTRCNVIEVSVF